MTDEIQLILIIINIKSACFNCCGLYILIFPIAKFTFHFLKFSQIFHTNITEMPQGKLKQKVKVPNSVKQKKKGKAFTRRVGKYDR